MADAETKVTITVKKEDREYSFICTNNSPLGEAYDAVQEIAAFIVSKINENQANQKPKDYAQEVI